MIEPSSVVSQISPSQFHIACAGGGPPMHADARGSSSQSAARFVSLPDMLAAAAAQTNDLDTVEVTKQIEGGGYNMRGLYGELDDSGEDGLLRELEVLGVTVRGQRKAILSTMKLGQ